MNNFAHTAEAMLPLSVPTYHILLALASGDKHGYSIQKDVAARTEGKVHLGPGTLYGALQRLLEQRLIAEVGEQPAPEQGNERRRYYTLTPFGKEVAVAESRRLSALVDEATVRGLLNPRLSMPSIRSMRHLRFKAKDARILVQASGEDP